MNTYKFGDDRDDAASRAATIRSLFVIGSTIEEHTEKCIREKVWSDTELLAMARVKAKDQVRDALGQITPEGIPFAGPTATKRGQSPVWRQMELWSKADFDFNFTAYRRRAKENTRIALNIARVCRERFGEDPVELSSDDADAE
jgi:hypothetical protein